MTKTTLLLASVAALALSAPAFSADSNTSYEAKTKVSADSNGNYSEKASAKSTDAAGTTTAAEKKVDVDVDSKGNVDKSVTTEASKDPKGLFNESKVKTKDTLKTKKGKIKRTHKKVVNGTTTEKTESTVNTATNASTNAAQ